MALGGISLLELLVIYLMFALGSLQVPRWSTPILSENASMAAWATTPPNKRSGLGMNLQQTQALGGAQASQGANAVYLVVFDISTIQLILCYQS